MTLRWLTSYSFVAKARTTCGQDADVHQQPRKTDAKIGAVDALIGQPALTA
ncbi:hypothetical protein [Streptomyces griseoviridis]|uniref:hypothetical protein n=1 Tax=Streptomyces griseoviridis TaxID=45398 RepID=UPI00342B096B